MRHSRLILSVTSAAVGLTLLSACGGGAAGPGTPVPVAQQQPGANAAGVGLTTTKLTAVDLGTLGPVITDKDGFTLYRFDKDTAKPPKSTCNDACATAWPPVLSQGEVGVDGVDAGLVGKVTRSDGTEQVTVGGWPVYRFAKDTQPGDTKGQGVSGTWFAVNPKGGKAGQAAEAANTKLSAGQVAGIGPVITDNDGFTLYLFEKDTKKPSKSNCNNDCATTWPPVLVKGKVELQGIEQKLLGSVQRADGSEQVTVGGWPVYRYSKDTAPGQANGQGVNGTWFTIEPAGCKSGATPPATTTTAAEAPASGSGY
jgi:predicted lipoprotein with Yx(FWY)xxD motif